MFFGGPRTTSVPRTNILELIPIKISNIELVAKEVQDYYLGPLVEARLLEMTRRRAKEKNPRHYDRFLS